MNPKIVSPIVKKMGKEFSYIQDGNQLPNIFISILKDIEEKGL